MSFSPLQDNNIMLTAEQYDKAYNYATANNGVIVNSGNRKLVFAYEDEADFRVVKNWLDNQNMPYKVVKTMLPGKGMKMCIKLTLAE